MREVIEKVTPNISSEAVKDVAVRSAAAAVVAGPLVAAAMETPDAPPKGPEPKIHEQQLPQAASFHLTAFHYQPKATSWHYKPEHSSQTSHHYSKLRERWLVDLRSCETPPHGDYTRKTDNEGRAYRGAYQFSDPTWAAQHTGYKYAFQAPKKVQDRAIIKNTQEAPGGLATQNPGCYGKIAFLHAHPKPPK